ncbi:MAG: hypothetical protein II752_09745 [Muribaculaceae bacterium]|nr:hypothetical protein [Muribaculaceae bacterium]
MKKNLTMSLVAIATIISLTGCFGGQTQSTSSTDELSETESNSKKEPNSISPLDAKFQGDLRDYFEIVDREYKPKKSVIDDYYYEVEIKRLQKPLPFNKGEELAKWNDEEGLLLKYQTDFFDEDGDLVCSGMDYSIPEDVAKLNPGETAFITIQPIQSFGEEENLYKIKKFKLKSTMRHNVPEGKAKASSNDVKDDEDFDKALEQTQKAMEVVGGAAKAIGELSKSL